MVVSSLNNRGDARNNRADGDQKAAMGEARMASGFSLFGSDPAGGEMGESLVSDIGMAGPHLHLALLLPKQIRIKRSWMDERKMLLTLTDFIYLAFLHCASPEVSS